MLLNWTDFFPVLRGMASSHVKSQVVVQQHAATFPSDLPLRDLFNIYQEVGSSNQLSWLVTTGLMADTNSMLNGESIGNNLELRGTTWQEVSRAGDLRPAGYAAETSLG